MWIHRLIKVKANLLKTIALLLEPGALEEVRRGHAEIDAGNYVTGEELAIRYVL